MIYERKKLGNQGKKKLSNDVSGLRESIYFLT